jgi:CubicO group peptidase (beta-lactamase class C family)
LTRRAALRPAVVLVGVLAAGPRAVAVEVLDEVRSFTAAAARERRIPGLAVVVMRGDDILLAEGYGVAELGHDHQPVTPATVFQLGSIGKQFLAALVLRQSEQGRLSLDDPLGRHLPGFAEGRPDLRVRHLLSHTSGIRELFTMPRYQAGIEDLSRGVAELEAMAREAPVDFTPGSRWSYSNTNYTILALLVERLSGVPYEEALDAALFRPLGLRSFRQCTPLPREPGEARGHVLRNDTLATAAPENMNWIRGDGGLCANALDLARWTRLLASGGVVTPKSYDVMSARTPLSNGRDADYGFGLALAQPDGLRKVAHNGAMLGFSASAAYYPDAQLTLIVLANRGGVRTESIERGIARRLLGVPAPARAEQALPTPLRRQLAGTYDIGVFPVRVVERAERLWLEMPPPGPTTALRYLGGRAFVGETDPDACRVDFDHAAPASELRLFMGAMHWYGVRSNQELVRE